MLVRKLTAQERPALEAISAIAFLYPMDMEAARKKVEEHPEDTTHENMWGCFDDDEKLVGGMSNWPFAIYYDGNVVGMGGIGGVAMLPEARMRGGIRSVFAKVFEDDLRMGRVFSVLFPFSHKYYRKFGYEICHEGRRCEFPVDRLSQYRQTGTARMHRPGEPDAAFRSLYAQYACTYNYAVARNDMAWERVLSGDPLKAQAYRYILSRGALDHAYCVFRQSRSADGILTMHVTDYAYIDREALYDLLGFLGRLSAQFTKIEIEVPDDFELAALLEEPYDITQAGFVRTMARVLDVEQALRLMRHPGPAGQYTIAITDDFLPQNTGTYAVAFGPDGVQVRRADAAPDITMTVQTLTQLCLGYLSLPMAALKPDVRLEANAETLERVFVKKRMFMTDRF